MLASFSVVVLCGELICNQFASLPARISSSLKKNNTHTHGFNERNTDLLFFIERRKEWKKRDAAGGYIETELTSLKRMLAFL